ncbi:MAG: 50S ribosomal protein L31 [Chloroflexi bacterium]|nr:50S ribosomal protein L31 [Chloroflexota bacterium]
MKAGIHPQWYPQAQVICGCGNTFTTGATVPVIRTDICSNCHPFFTGEQRIVDTAGQVERFMRRVERGKGMVAPQEAPSQSAKPQKAPAKKGKPTS